MVDDPLISVIIPSFNRASLIGSTIQSVLDQSYSNWECIVVDDHSSDLTLEVLKKRAAEDPRIKVHRRPDSRAKGANACRNFGAEKARGQYLIFLDSDDLLASRCLSLRMDTIHKNPDFDLWIFPTLCFKEQPGDLDIAWNQLNKPERDLDRFLLDDVPWSVMGPIWKEEAFESTQKWNESLCNWQDWELHIRAILHPLYFFKSEDFDFDNFCRVNHGQSIASLAHTLEYTRSCQKAIFSAARPLQEKQWTQPVQSSLFDLLYRRLYRPYKKFQDKKGRKEVEQYFRSSGLLNSFQLWIFLLTEKMADFQYIGKSKVDRILINPLKKMAGIPNRKDNRDVTFQNYKIPNSQPKVEPVAYSSEPR